MKLLNRLFGRKPPQPTAQRLEITGRPATFATLTGGDPWANDVFRSGVDAIARIAAKFVLQPVISFSDGTTAACDERLARILQVRPNAYQTAYDFLYQLFTILYTRNNSFAYIQRDSQNRVVGLYPLHVSQCEIVEDGTGTLWAAMIFANGKSYTLPYSDIIHLRRHLNSQDVLGDSNGAISAAVSLADAQNAGMQASIKTSGSIRGIVRIPGAVAKPEREKFRREFESTFLSPESSGGVVVSDSTFEYVPFETREPATISAEDQAEVKAKIYSYLGISESIVNSSFDDSTFGAFEEAVIEALALQTSLEFTSKIYPQGNRRIDVSTSRIRYIGQQHKTELLKHLLPMGLMSLNEGRDLLGMAPIEGGERRIQSLNYIDSELASRYQLVRSGSNGIKALAPAEEGE